MITAQEASQISIEKVRTTYMEAVAVYALEFVDTIIRHVANKGYSFVTIYEASDVQEIVPFSKELNNKKWRYGSITWSWYDMKQMLFTLPSIKTLVVGKLKENGFIVSLGHALSSSDKLIDTIDISWNFNSAVNKIKLNHQK